MESPGKRIDPRYYQIAVLGTLLAYGIGILDFGVSLNASAAANAGNYQIDTVTTKKVKKKLSCLVLVSDGDKRKVARMIPYA